LSDISDKVDKVISLLTGKTFSQDDPVFAQALKWVELFPQVVDSSRRSLLIKTMIATFGITERDIYARIAKVDPAVQLVPEPENPESALKAALPHGSFLDWYTDYTRGTESPMSYHVFSGLCVLGAALGRRVFKDKGGFFKIFPNQCTILIGPPGKVMKTSAVDIATSFIKEAVLCPIMADAITPESIVDALVQSGHHFIYAPEFSIFFGRQKYNEGLTTLMLRLLDSPSEYTRKTVTRGDITISNIALSILGGSTMSLLTTATPDQVTSSGFLNRFTPVVENETTRSFPEPVAGDPRLRHKMLETLTRFKAFAGQITFDTQATKWFEHWYNVRKKLLNELDSEAAAETIQRGPVHLERISMLVHLSHCDTFEVCERCCEVAKYLLDYVETRIPQITTALNMTSIARDADLVLTMLTRLGGVADRSTLMRRVSSRMGKLEFDRHINTLRETRALREEKRGLATIYVLEGNNA
jgi:hypothetical protein